MLPNLATGRTRAAVKVISADELIENGGSFRLQGRVAFRVNNLTGQTSLPASHQAMAVYPVTQADIDSGRFVLAGGGPAVRVVDIDSEGISRAVMSGGAVPVYVVEGEALGVVPTPPSEPTYDDKILAYLPTAYWPLSEASGTVANCLVNAAQNGTASASGILGATTWTDGSVAASFVAASVHRINIYTATFAAAFNGASGSLSLWARVSGAGVYTDATLRGMAIMDADVNNRLRMIKTTVNNRLDAGYRAGGTDDSIQVTPFSNTNWFHFCQTWDRGAGASGEFKAYINGVQQSLPATTLGTWAGSPASTTTIIGALSSAGAGPWDGDIARVAVFDYAGSALEVADWADPLP